MKIFIFALIMALMVTMISAASFGQDFTDPAQYASFAGDIIRMQRSVFEQLSDIPIIFKNFVVMLWKIHCGNDRTLTDMKIFIFALIMALMVIMASADAFDGANYFPNPPGAQYSSFATYSDNQPSSGFRFPFFSN
ncbi:Histatin-1 [Manis pentadactyla]|nr:Histatin-1 [Manis pentadactyla]